jgi:hypothetical protein
MILGAAFARSRLAPRSRIDFAAATWFQGFARRGKRCDWTFAMMRPALKPTSKTLAAAKGGATF